MNCRNPCWDGGRNHRLRCSPKPRYGSFAAFPQGCSVTLILASTSPIRLQMLDAAGVACEAVKPQVDEEELKLGLTDPAQIALRLATAKAVSVPGEWVIGSDSVVT